MGRLMTIIGTLIVIGIIAGAGYFAYVTFIVTGDSKDDSIRYGDAVLVNYIGRFENGRVFDTSLWDVAVDNYTYPKAVSFSMRAKNAYQPFNFTIGKGAVIKGWEIGVMDMKVGQTKVLNLSKELAYGDPDPSLIKTLPLVQEVPLITEMNSTDFYKKYTVHPSMGLEVVEPVWEWTATVIHISGDTITVRANPQIGAVVKPYKKWDSRVKDIDSGADDGKGKIWIEHLIKPDIVDNILDTDNEGKEFRLTGLSIAKGTFTIDYNREVVGKTLIFQITVLKIYR